MVLLSAPREFGMSSESLYLWIPQLVNVTTLARVRRRVTELEGLQDLHVARAQRPIYRSGFPDGEDQEYRIQGGR